MSNKLSKKQLDLLIERVLNEGFSDFFPRRKITNKSKLIKQKTGTDDRLDRGVGDGKITKFLSKYNLEDNPENREKIARMYNSDNKPRTLSKRDLQSALQTDEYADIAKAMAKVIYSNKDPDKTLVDFFDTWFKKLRIGIDGNNIHIEPEFFFPAWVRLLGADRRVVKKAAEEEDPVEIFTNEDVIKIIEDSKNPLHYWMLDFLEKSVVFAQQKRFKENAANRFILDNFPDLIAKSKRLDPEDKGLGRGKSLPNIPISGRYATTTGGETPETLDRIFKNAKVLTGSSVKQKMESVEKFMTSVKNKEYGGLSIEEISSNMIVVDYFKRIVQDYEASAGGFLFENFLALLLSGTKEGGNLKIEDFTYFKRAGKGATQVLGSAKLYRINAKQYSGSKKLFYNAGLRASSNLGIEGKGVKIEYVLAKKGLNLEKVEIFLDTIYANKTDDEEVTLYNKEMQQLAVLGPKDKGQIEFDWPTSNPVATVNFLAMKIEDNNYQEIVKEAMNSTKEKLGNLNIAINNLATSVTKFFSILNTDTAQKSSSWEQTMVDIRKFRYAAYDTFIEVEETQRVDSDARKATVRDVTKGELSDSGQLALSLEENNKKSKKDLDNLIKEVILKRLLK